MHAESLDKTDSDLSFQHYKVLRKADGAHWELGRGSMGITYKAFDVNLCCEVALKAINAATLEHPHARERFVSEARAAAKLRHRNVASVFHLGNDGEHYFYAMEFVAGETLDSLVRRQGPLPVATTLRILLQAARALAAASRQGLVHRDLKPANIMITHEDDDEEMLVKVIDFGLAKPITSAAGSRPSTFGGFVGTPQFASPEQLEERRVDGRSDIYSLGATAWFLLTGRAPFLGSLATICRQHLTQPPPWNLLPKPFPETVRALLALMLEKDPARRPADAVDLRRQIEAALEVIREPATQHVPVFKKFVAKPPSWARAREPQPTAGLLSDGETPRTGVILNGRYELLRLVGEGNSGQVFAAHDRSANEALVAIKLLHPELVANAASADRLGEEVKRIQAAAHPRLIQIASMENLASQATAFLVEEWLHGFTLLEFLAVRGGVLPVSEAMRIVEQAAAAADHADRRQLSRLDFALHQFHLHFPASGPAVDDPEAARRPMPAAMSQWPAWSLKLNPLGSLRNGLESSTWAGDVTLIPGAAGLKDAEAAPLALRELYTRGVAQLTCELLGGAPASPVYGNREKGKHASLPALNESANAMLQRGLNESGEFASATAFYEALRQAAEYDSAGVPAALPTVQSEAHPFAAIPVIRRAPPVVSLKEPLGLILSEPARPLPEDDPIVPAQPAWRSAKSMTVRPAATFDGQGNATPDGAGVWEDADEPAGTVWDRLALVSGEGTSSRWWLGGVAAAFIVLLAGCFLFLRFLEHRPSRFLALTAAKAAQTPKPPLHRKLNSATAAKARAVAPSPAHPDALALNQVADNGGPVQTPKPASPKPVVPIPSPDVSMTPAEAADTPPPLVAETHDKLIRVHVESRPPGVEVSAKGKVLGHTPLDASLPPGDYQLVAHYRNWPEVHQSLHLEGGDQSVSTDLHMMAPALVPTVNVVNDPQASLRRTQQDAIAKRNFVRSTRGNLGPDSPVPSPDVSTTPAPAIDSRRPTPALDPFDPNGVFRQNGRQRDNG